MDQTTLVKEQIDFGEKLIERLPKGGFDVTAAFWLKHAENGQWYFYIISTVKDEDYGGSYGRLRPLMRQMPRPYWIDPHEIRLLGTSDRMAKDVLKIYDNSARTGLHPQLWRGSVLGGMAVDATYFYLTQPSPERQPSGTP